MADVPAYISEEAQPMKQERLPAFQPSRTALLTTPLPSEFT